MLEFDLNKALEITYSGVIAAFMVLAFLIVFTALLSRLTHYRAQARAAVETSTIEATSEIPSHVPLTASAMSAEGADSSDIAGTPSIDDWKSYGRLEAFLSRGVRRRDG